MLRGLRIRNFKAWRDTGEIQMAPLTLFFGPNSSGKSSINHFLMMLKQTVRSADRNSVFDFGDANAAVRLGSFRDIIFRHDTENTLEFELEWHLGSSVTIRDPRSGRRYAGDRLYFKGSARQPPERGRAVQSEGFAYRLDGPSGTELAVTISRDERRPSRWGIDTENYDLVRNPGRAWELPKPIQFHGFPEQATVYYQNAAFLSELELALEAQLTRISYLGPIRSPPERLYTWSGGVPEDVGWQGESTVQAILAARDRRLNWQPRARRRPLEEVVAEWLKKMGLIHSFGVVAIAPDREEFEVRVRVAPGTDEVKLSDVGFGVSQVLPVLVQAFYAPPHSTVLMEQPEIHLHPSSQSLLADALIAAIGAREEGRPRQVQMVVESHSEHLLRRLQRRIADETIDENDVALYFSSAGTGARGASINRLEVDSFGDILNWPPDFFGDELEDITVQAEVGLQRKLDLSG